MSIDPVLPVNMSGAVTATLQTDLLSTLMPVVAAFFTVLATFVIVKLTNELSFKKTQRLLEQNKEIERMRIAAKEQASWEEALRVAVSEFIGLATQYQYITRDWLEIEKNKPEIVADKDVILASQGIDRETTRKIMQCRTNVRVLLSRDVPEHEEVLQNLYKIHKEVLDLRNNASVHKRFQEYRISDDFYIAVERAVQKGKSWNNSMLS